MTSTPRVLSIAGTDPTGGAGIQADLKSIAANRGYGMAVVTALVAQNTHGVRSVHTPPVPFLTEQLEAVSDDVDIDAVKIGMLGSAPVIETVQAWLEKVSPPVVVLDPVMVATSGDRLLDADAEAALSGLLPRADLITPNLPELAVLAGTDEASSWDEAVSQAAAVARRYGVLVLAKGGHASGDTVHDALVSSDGVQAGFDAPRVHTSNTHGTGCSMSSAVATLRAQTGDWASAVEQAKTWLTDSIRHADELQVGSGNGPVSHFATLWGNTEHSSASPSGAQAAGMQTAQQIEESWWQAIADVRERIDASDFVTGLVDGSLPLPVFRHYLLQDTLYLHDYSRALAQASSMAPGLEAQRFWAESSLSALAGETEMHAHYLGDLDAAQSVPKAPATVAYTDHLAASGARGGYPVLIAAVLPCFWIYTDTGTRMLPRAHADSPYLPWLRTYEDPEFAASTRRAIDIVTDVAARVDEGTRELMWQAFRTAAEHELAFFTEPLTVPPLGFEPRL